MWPILDAYGVKISVAKRNGKTTGLLIESVGDAASASKPDYDALTAAGFNIEGSPNNGRMLLPNQNAFTVGQLKAWFPGFDAMSMIDRDAPVAVVNLDPLPEVGPQPGLGDAGTIPDKHQDVSGTQSAPDGKHRVKRVKKPKITDVGEKIGRARKDLYSKGVRVEDLSGMNDADRDKYVKKIVIWPYSFKGAKERGVACAVALWLKDLRANMLEMGDANPEHVTHEIFIRCVKAFQRHFDPVKTGDDLVNAIVKLKSDPDWISYDEAIRRSWVKSGKHRKWINFKSMVAFGKDQFDFAVKEGRSPLEALSGYKTYLDREDNAAARDYIWSTKLGVKTAGQLDSMRKKRESGPKIPSRPHLDNIRNDWLSGEDITPEQLMERFGFRAVEFGEWLPQDERQRVMNEAYASCAAMAETLGIPDKAVSFNGTLAAAFGSRGKGKASAHYEPDLKVFNLTRINGAGSMAHEWGHGLDNYISSTLLGRGDAYASELVKNSVIIELTPLAAVMDAIQYTSDTSKWLDEQFEELSRGIRWASSWLRVPRDRRDDLTAIVREEVLTAAGINIDQSRLPSPSDALCVKFSPDDATAELSPRLADTDLYDRLRDILESPTVFGDSVKLREDPMSVRNSKDPSKQFYLNTRTALRAAKRLRDFIENPEAFADMRKTSDSSFKANAEKLDTKKSKAYWNTPRELFARAFECFVNDTLTEKLQRPCEYLVHSVGGNLYDGSGYAGNPYPFGPERVAINEQMALLASRLRFIMSPDAKLAAACISNSITSETACFMARAALLSGADPNLSVDTARGARSVFELAIDNTQMCRLLIEYGADTKAHGTRMAAIHNGEIANELLRNGDYSISDDVDLAGNGKYTLLGWAVQCGRIDIVSALLAAGANTEISCNSYGFTALESAVHHKRPEVVSRLLAGGAEVTPRCIAIARGECREAACYLNEPLLDMLMQYPTKQKMRA